MMDDHPLFTDVGSDNEDDDESDLFGSIPLTSEKAPMMSGTMGGTTNILPTNNGGQSFLFDHENDAYDDDDNAAPPMGGSAMDGGFGDFHRSTPATSIFDDPLSSFVQGAPSPPPPAPPAPAPAPMIDDSFYRPHRVTLPSEPPPTPPSIPTQSSSVSYRPPPSHPPPSPPKVSAPPPPPRSNARYGNIVVSNPTLIEKKGYFTTTSYWTYEITTGTLPNSPPIAVRRRFRNVVTLHERLRLALPGVILPPRPEKTETRAIEEGRLTQSADFAKRRVGLIQTYLTELGKHPLVGGQDQIDYRNFLVFNGDLSHMWPEDSAVSLSSLASGAEKMILGGKSNPKSGATETKMGDNGRDGDDPDSVLVTLMHGEQLRLDKINNAVPKLLAAVSLLEQQAEWGGGTGMEIQKLSKDIKSVDVGLASAVEVLSTPLLKSGRRSKALKVELLQGGSMGVFLTEYRRVANTLAAFEDRRYLVRKMLAARRVANEAAVRLERAEAEALSATAVVSYNMVALGYEVDRTEEDAVKAMSEAEAVGEVLKGEILRLGGERRRLYRASLLRVAEAMARSARDKGVLWEEALTKLQKECPGPNVAKATTSTDVEDLLFFEGRGEIA